MVQQLGFSVKASRQSQIDFLDLIFEIGAWTELVHFIHMENRTLPGYCGPTESVLPSIKRGITLFSEVDSEFLHLLYSVGLYLFKERLVQYPGCSIECGGKRRIFAIGNYVNHWLLRPVHDP